MQSSSLHHHHHHHPLLRFRTIRHSAPASHLKLHPTPPLHRRQYSSPAPPGMPMQSPRAHSSSSDLAPVPPSLRTFTALDMASLWVGLVVGVPSYYLAGSLVALGMAWWQGVATVVAANFVVLLVLVLTGVPGAKYGIPFPILARSSFGNPPRRSRRLRLVRSSSTMIETSKKSVADMGTEESSEMIRNSDLEDTIGSSTSATTLRPICMPF